MPFIYRLPIRHCVLACSLTRRLGRSVAQQIMQGHEDANGDNDLMDQRNNEMGCFIGDNFTEQTCEQACYSNMGSLMTGRTQSGELLGRPVPISEAPIGGSSNYFGF